MGLPFKIISVSFEHISFCNEKETFGFGFTVISKKLVSSGHDDDPVTRYEYIQKH